MRISARWRRHQRLLLEQAWLDMRAPQCHGDAGAFATADGYLAVPFAAASIAADEGDGARFLVAGEMGTLQRVLVDTHATVEHIDVGIADAILDLNVADHRVFMAGSDGYGHVWDLQAQQPVWRERHGDVAKRCRPWDGRDVVAMAGTSGLLRLRDMRDPSTGVTFATPNGQTISEFAAIDAVAVITVGTGNCDAHVWDGRRPDRPLFTLPAVREERTGRVRAFTGVLHHGGIVQLACTNGNVLDVAFDRAVGFGRCWLRRSALPTTFSFYSRLASTGLGGDYPAATIASSTNGNSYIMPYAQCWPTEEAVAVPSFATGESGEVTALAWCPHTHSLFLGSEDGSMGVYRSVGVEGDAGQFRPHICALLELPIEDPHPAVSDTDNEDPSICLHNDSVALHWGPPPMPLWVNHGGRPQRSQQRSIREFVHAATPPPTMTSGINVEALPSSPWWQRPASPHVGCFRSEHFDCATSSIRSSPIRPTIKRPRR